MTDQSKAADADEQQSDEKLLTHDDGDETGNEKTGSGKNSEDPEVGKPAEEREQWTDPVQFFMTFLGYCVGLGNIWRFPYLCQQNGGGAFVIPFLIMMVLEGMPLLLLELGIGQKLRQGSLGVWNTIHPCFGGIGFGSTVVACIVGCYYNMIIAWCFYYLFNSFRLSLPWSECPTELVDEVSNATVVVQECQMSSETQYFWYRSALDVTEEIGDFGGIRWWMLLCLIFAWVVTFLIIMKGIQTSGKVVYFTALFPYVVMTIFFIRGLTLKGAGAGLAHMFFPNLESLLKPTVWLDAATQVFYSYGLGMGTLISFGSYNNYNTNVVRDVYLFSACNAFTCVYACAVVFTILGFKAQTLFDRCMHEDIATIMKETSVWAGQTIENITESDYFSVMSSGMDLPVLKNCSLEQELNQAAQGTGLAFIVMADVFTMLPGSPFWSLLFFSMLLSLGIGSQIGIMEGMIGTLFDIPQLKHIKKPILTGGCCLFCFLVGVLFTTGAGEYWLTLVDTYGATGLTLIALIEVIIVMYVYGHERFTEDIREMTGVKIGIYWQITWRFVAPILIFVILAASIIFQIMNSTNYNYWNQANAASDKRPYPGWALFLAVLLTLASTIPMLIVAAVRGLPMLRSRFGAGQSNDQPAKNVEVPLITIQAADKDGTSA